MGNTSYQNFKMTNEDQQTKLEEIAEKDHQEKSQPEGGCGKPDVNEYSGRFVKPGIRPHRRQDPDRDGHDQNQNERYQIDHDGDRYPLQDFVPDEPSVNERSAEVQMNETVQPLEILDVKRLIQTIKPF